MGMMQREKGKDYERRVASAMRAAFPFATVRRSSQADRAHAPDVRFETGPELLRQLWLECNDARQPNPLGKLEQAERDTIHGPDAWLPVVVWHRFREREDWATLRIRTLRFLLGVGVGNARETFAGHAADNETATVSLGTFVRIVTAALERRGEMPAKEAA
jgi:hypothetical protein